MGWKIVSVSEVPIGGRNLRIGSKGNDVHQLQKLLMEAGFYFGPVDGIYGILTEEAVWLFQRSFNLRCDGIAGPKLFAALKNASLKQNRIIYTVKPKDNLKSISCNFGVAGSAWRGIPGQGNPQHKIYPGMKLLLNQKVVFCSGKTAADLQSTAYLENGWELTTDGELVRLDNLIGGETYQTVVAQPDTWEKILSSPKCWQKIGANFKRVSKNNWGIDLRNAPLERIFRWKDFLQYLCKVTSINQIPMLLIPMLAEGKAVKNRLYWLNLAQFSNCTGLLLIEPSICLDSPVAFQQSCLNLGRTLQKLIQFNLGPKTLLVGRVGGWDWNIDQGYQCRPVSFREGRILAAMNPRSVKYNQGTMYTVIGYTRRRERHCLIFRDQQGWHDWVKLGLRSNLLGFVFHDLQDLGRFGGELLRSSFGVLPKEKFMK